MMVEVHLEHEVCYGARKEQMALDLDLEHM
jgi:hypothetical protein